MKPRFSLKSTKALKMAAVLACASFPAAFLLPGCGGGGSGNGPSQSFTAGGQLNLGNQQTGALGFALFSNDTAYGTFTIATIVGTPTPGPTPTAVPTTAPAGGPYKVGSFNISGTAKNRVVTLKGTDPDLGLFTVVVNLPSSGLQGTFTAEIKGRTYNGTFAIAGPTPTSTSTPTAVATSTPAATATLTPAPTFTPAP